MPACGHGCLPSLSSRVTQCPFGHSSRLLSAQAGQLPGPIEDACAERCPQGLLVQTKGAAGRAGPGPSVQSPIPQDRIAQEKMSMTCSALCRTALGLLGLRPRHSIVLIQASFLLLCLGALFSLLGAGPGVQAVQSLLACCCSRSSRGPAKTGVLSGSRPGPEAPGGNWRLAKPLWRTADWRPTSQQASLLLVSHSP